MAVRPGALENPERNAPPLSTREEAPAAGAVDLPELKRRIKAARAIVPQRVSDLHCRDCFNRGRDAALRVIDGIDKT